MSAQSEYQQVMRDTNQSRRKQWDGTKKYAARWGVDTKVFNKGLGPALDKFGALTKGAAEVDAMIPMDDRTVNPLRAAKAKLDPILAGYTKITDPEVKKHKKGSDAYWAWYALDQQLKSLQTYANKVMALAEAKLAQNKGRR